MRVTNISVALEMRRSNGDYGSDKAEVTLTAALEPTDGAEFALLQLLGMARSHVEQDLQRSPSLAVRRALITEYRTCNRCGERLDDAERGYLHPACREAEDAEREERRQRMKSEDEERARQWAESNAAAEERELAGVTAANNGEDEEEPY